MWNKTCKNCYYNKYPADGYLKRMHCILKPENTIGVLNFKPIKEEKEMKKYQINMQMTVDFRTMVDAQDTKDASVWDCRSASMKTNEILTKRPLILLCGKSGSGKTTVAELLQSKYGLKELLSYTTRPRRSDDEGGHLFVDNSFFRKHEKEGLIVADTTINGYKYWATIGLLCDADVYVIDPKTALELAEKVKDEREVIIVYLTCPEVTRVYRMTKRGDSLEEINTRLLIENNWDEYIATLNYKRQRFDSGKDGAEQIAKAIISVYNFCLTGKRI